MSDTFEMVTDDGFDAAVEAQIAAATGAEPEAEPEAKTDGRLTRERDEHGRYKPAASEEPEPEPEPEPELPPAAEADPLAELKAAYEARLKDKDDFIGRLSNEVGQLRQAVPSVPQAQTPVEFADQIVESPSLGAKYAADALKAGDWDQYDAVMDVWEEVDKRAAKKYERQVNVWLASQQINQATEPLTANVRESQNTQALANLTDRYSDFPQVIASLEGEENIPSPLTRALQDAPNQVAYEEALDTLYNFLKGKQAGPLATQVREASEAERAEARQAKVDATVASASASPVREETLTIQESIVKEWADLDAPFADPWSRD